MRSPIIWFGSKTVLSKHIVPILNAHLHMPYVEVFGGSGAVLFAKTPSNLETFNDLDEALYDFFSVVADPDLFELFFRRVSMLPYSRKFYYDYLETWATEEDIVPRVAKWFIVARQSFSGLFGQSWCYGNHKSKITPWLGALDGLPEVHARLHGVQIESRDFRDILKYFHDSVFYLDPPYVPETRRAGNYRHEMTEEDHAEMVQLMLEHDRWCILSGYDHEIYVPLESAGYQKRTFDVVCHSAAAPGKTKGTTAEERNQLRQECLWIHPKLVGPRQMGLFER